MGIFPVLKNLSTLEPFNQYFVCELEKQHETWDNSFLDFQLSFTPHISVELFWLFKKNNFFLSGRWVGGFERMENDKGAFK